MRKRTRLAQYKKAIDTLRAKLREVSESIGPYMDHVERDQAMILREKIQSAIGRARRKANELRGTLDALALACRAMVEEQCLIPCGVPWCGHKATHEWVRSAKDLKSMARKYKGQTLTGEPVSIRCETHIPDWRLVQYVALTGVAHVEAVA